jgi:hypothetical protein
MAEKKNNNKNQAFNQTVRGLVTGSIINSDLIKSQLPFIAFIGILGLIYISNRYHAEKVFRESENIKAEIEELRSEKIIIQSKLMNKSRREEVLKMLEEYDSELKEFTVPPKTIVFEK